MCYSPLDRCWSMGGCFCDCEGADVTVFTTLLQTIFAVTSRRMKTNKKKHVTFPFEPRLHRFKSQTCDSSMREMNCFRSNIDIPCMNKWAPILIENMFYILKKSKKTLRLRRLHNRTKWHLFFCVWKWKSFVTVMNRFRHANAWTQSSCMKWQFLQ